MDEKISEVVATDETSKILEELDDHIHFQKENIHDEINTDLSLESKNELPGLEGVHLAGIQPPSKIYEENLPAKQDIKAEVELVL